MVGLAVHTAGAVVELSHWTLVHTGGALVLLMKAAHTEVSVPELVWGTICAPLGVFISLTYRTHILALHASRVPFLVHLTSNTPAPVIVLANRTHRVAAGPTPFFVEFTRALGPVKILVGGTGLAPKVRTISVTGWPTPVLTSHRVLIKVFV